MWATIITSAISVVLFVAKWAMQKRAGKKLSDAEFIEHIAAHQLRRAGVATRATDFETAMQEAYNDLDKKN